MKNILYCPLTFVRTSDQTRSHADFLVPVDRMETHVASDERFVQVVDTLQIFVNVASEFL